MPDNSERERGPGRPQINAEQTPARFPAGTLASIDDVLAAGEKRSDFIRMAVESEVVRRRSRREGQPVVDEAKRGTFARAIRVQKLVDVLLENPSEEFTTRYVDSTRDEVAEAKATVQKMIVRMHRELKEKEG